MRCIRLDLEYEGTAYHGWQIQPEAPTIQQQLERALLRITRQCVRVIGAGRTDAGVHALGQVAHFHTDSGLEPERLKMALNSLLPGDIAVKDVSEMSGAFHARKSALNKRYEYWIWNGRTASVFSKRFAWHVVKPLDIDRMRQAAGEVVGTHDFSSLQATGSPPGLKPVRTVQKLLVECRGRSLVRIAVEADGFLRHMVRILTGTLVEVGLGRRCPQDMETIVLARDRRAAGRTSPGKGLFLRWVRYPAEFQAPQRGEEEKMGGLYGYLFDKEN